MDSAPPGAHPGRPLLAPDGSVRLGPLLLPFSNLASEAARETFMTQINPPPAEIGTDLLALRAHYDRTNAVLAAHMRDIFAVEVEPGEMGGARVNRVRPAGPHDGDRALICLHGGAFAWGNGSGALVEAIPIAATLGVEVVAIDYRLGPEHVFPAACEDVANVYGELLNRFPPQALGLFGCSAGAILTAQSMAWFAKAGLPPPGAIALLGAGAGDLDGDSRRLSLPLEGVPPGEPLTMSSFPYFAGASFDDPCVAPINHPDVLRAFPPTLLIGGGRDFGLGSLTRLHLSLDSVGVEAQLFVFDGLWHAFHIYPDLPESRQVYAILGKFFDRRLKRA